jgi:hypothetical protein
MSTFLMGSGAAPLLRRHAALLVLGCALAACKPAEPVKITSIELGTFVSDDKSISSPSETFASSSTIYASIATEGAAAGTLKAQWVSADGQTLTEQTQQINPTKPTHFEFHFAPPGGWPKGRHKVTFTLNGTGTRTREFEVR